MTRYCSSIMLLMLGLLLWLPLKSEAQTEINQRRGIVLYPSDITSVGAIQWVQFLKQNNLNLLGIHTDTRMETLPKLKAFLESEEGKTLINECQKHNINIEYELHILQNILPREVFDKHPEYFRMDKDGKRQRAYNMCFTSDSAYKVIEDNVTEILTWLQPTTHRYFFWTDDVSDAFCHCPACKNYSPSEQALLYENRVLEILKSVDPEAQVAHLAYVTTLPAPEKITPSEGVFLEYAPIDRDYDKPLPESHLDKIRRNLEIFPADTAHILEYWLDASRFSGWDRNQLKQIPWDKSVCGQDVMLYRGLGITSITTFGAWINQDYIDKFGMGHVETVLSEYGEIQRSASSKVEENTDKRIIVPALPESLESSIKLDGRLEEPLWEQTCQRSDFMFPWQEESAPATRFYIAVCGQYCYFAFEVRDEDIVVFDSWDGEATVAKEDRVEFFITAQEDLSEYYCAEIDPLGRVLDYKAEFYRKLDDTWNCTGLEVKGHQTNTGYVVEGRIPRSFFDELMTSGNKPLGFGLYRAEFSRGEGNAIEEHWISWKRPESEEPDFHIASSFGEIIFK